ncbi:MAG: DMT family transporter [Deltaproteobacteria bacterium]|nr:DMT family transporter [Deltaproteobacteria bacterium]MBW2447835.1 DMT family transporter [Deltaproteobacteria bacterium]
MLAGIVPVHQSSGRRRLGFGLACATMISWGILPVALSGILSRLDPITITGVRFVVSAAVLAGALGLGRSRPALGGLARGNWALLAVATAFLAANYLGYIVGLHHTTPADAQVLIQGAPILLALAGVWVFREPFSRIQWAGFALLVAGIAIFSVSRLATVLALPGSEDHLYGNAMIGLAAVTWAIYGIAQKQLLRVLPSQHIMVCIYLGCALIFFPLADLSALGSLDGAGWALLIFCALNTVVAYGCFAEALQHWEASRVSAVLALVPLMTLGFQRLTLVFFPGFDTGPPLDATAILGACTVVAGSLVTSLGAPSAARDEASDVGLS